MIIGLSGKKGSGKTTTAEYLKEKIDGSHIVAFADPLKSIVSNVFGVPMFNLAGPEAAKNELTQAGKTGRQLMQEVGNGMRQIWPLCWVHAWRSSVNDLYAQCGVVPVIVPDVRYANEISIIRLMGGIVIRLTRNPFPADSHESENAIDDEKNFNLVIHNALLTEAEANAEILDRVRKMGIV